MKELNTTEISAVFGAGYSYTQYLDSSLAMLSGGLLTMMAVAPSIARNVPNEAMQNVLLCAAAYLGFSATGKLWGLQADLSNYFNKEAN